MSFLNMYSLYIWLFMNPFLSIVLLTFAAACLGLVMYRCLQSTEVVPILLILALVYVLYM